MLIPIGHEDQRVTRLPWVTIGLIVLVVHEPDNPSIRFGWWCILGIYVLTCLTAMVVGR